MMNNQNTAFAKSLESTDVSTTHVKNDDLFLRNPIIHAEIVKLLSSPMDKVIETYIQGYKEYQNEKTFPIVDSKVRIAAMLVLDMYCNGSKKMIMDMIRCHMEKSGMKQYDAKIIF